MYSMNHTEATLDESLKLMRAIADATKWHASAVKKGTDPACISHAFSLLALLQMHLTNDEDVLIAAVFHDCIHSTECTLNWIEASYGRRVAKIVSGVNASRVSNKWAMQKKHLIDTYRRQSYEIKLIILADNLHHLITINEELRESGEKYWDCLEQEKTQQRWYFTRLAQTFNKDLVMTRHPMVTQFVNLVERIFHVPKFDMPSSTRPKQRETLELAMGEGFITSEIPYTSNTILCGSRTLKTYSLAREAVVEWSQATLLDLMEQQALFTPLNRPVPLALGIEKDDEGLDCLTVTLTLAEGDHLYCNTWDLISIEVNA